MEDNYGAEQPQEPGETRPLPSGEPAPEVHGAEASHQPAGSEPPAPGDPAQPASHEPPAFGAEPSPEPPAGAEPSQPPGSTEPPGFGTEPSGDQQPAFGTEPAQPQGSAGPLGSGTEPSYQPGGEPARPASDFPPPAGNFPAGNFPPPGGGVPPLPGSQVQGSPVPGDDTLTGGYWPPPPPGNLPPPPGGYGYGGYGGYGTWPGAPQPPRRRGRALLAVAVVAIVAAGAGAAATLAVRNTGSNQPTGSSGPGAGSVPQPGSQRPPLNNTGVSKLNVSAIAHEVDPSVVDITSNISEPQSVTAQGTGMILNSHGLVLTNNHVIADASKVTAQIAGTSQTYPVKVLGTDVSADVALLQLQGASGLKAASFGDSNKAAVGDGVVDLGNACGVGGTPTVTQGAVTALNRSIQAGDQGNQSSENLHGMIQTDAAITEGDSGGPLVNSTGQVIGMVTAAEGTGTSCQQTSNMGFAIPVDTALSIARQIAAGHGNANIQIGPRAGLGVTVEDASRAAQGQGGSGGPGGGSGGAPGGGSGGGPGGGIGGGPGGGIGGGPGGGLGNGYTPPVNSGALIIQVVQGSPAQSAGLTSGDVITGLNGSSISSSSALSKALASFHPGNRVSVTYVDANGKHHTVPVALGTVPPA